MNAFGMFIGGFLAGGLTMLVLSALCAAAGRDSRAREEEERI